MDYYVDLEGENFFPKEISWPKYISIIDINNKYDKSKYTNKEFDFGSVRLQVQRKKLFEVLDFVLLNKLLYGIESIHLFLLVEFENQCNFEFSEFEIQKISSYNIGVSITCIEKG